MLRSVRGTLDYPRSPVTYIYIGFLSLGPYINLYYLYRKNLLYEYLGFWASRLTVLQETWNHHTLQYLGLYIIKATSRHIISVNGIQFYNVIYKKFKVLGSASSWKVPKTGGGGLVGESLLLKKKYNMSYSLNPGIPLNNPDNTRLYNAPIEPPLRSLDLNPTA